MRATSRPCTFFKFIFTKAVRNSAGRKTCSPQVATLRHRIVTALKLIDIKHANTIGLAYSSVLVFYKNYHFQFRCNKRLIILTPSRFKFALSFLHCKILFPTLASIRTAVSTWGVKRRLRYSTQRQESCQKYYLVWHDKKIHYYRCFYVELKVFLLAFLGGLFGFERPSSK